MPGHGMVFQGGPGGQDEPARRAGEQDVALVHVPRLEHAGGVRIADDVRKRTQAALLMVHRAQEI